MSEVSRPHSMSYLANEARNALISMRDESARPGHAREAEQGLAALDGLLEQLEAATKQRDAIMAMLEAERPPEEVFAYARSLSNTAAGSRERDLSLGPISPPASDPANEPDA